MEEGLAHQQASTFLLNSLQWRKGLSGQQERNGAEKGPQHDGG